MLCLTVVMVAVGLGPRARGQGQVAVTAPQQAITVDAGENVGIGTDLPEADLHVNTDDTFTFLRLSAAGAGSEARAVDLTFTNAGGNGNQTFRMNLFDTDGHEFAVDMNGKLTLPQAGSQLGIGTDTPAGPLHVGSRTGAVARQDWAWLYPGFPPSCPFSQVRDSVSSSRHLAGSVRISLTTRSCTLRLKAYETYWHDATAALRRQ